MGLICSPLCMPTSGCQRSLVTFFVRSIDLVANMCVSGGDGATLHRTEIWQHIFAQALLDKTLPQVSGRRAVTCSHDGLTCARDLSHCVKMPLRTCITSGHGSTRGWSWRLGLPRLRRWEQELADCVHSAMHHINFTTPFQHMH